MKRSCFELNRGPKPTLRYRKVDRLKAAQPVLEELLTSVSRRKRSKPSSGVAVPCLDTWVRRPATAETTTVADEVGRLSVSLAAPADKTSNSEAKAASTFVIDILQSETAGCFLARLHKCKGGSSAGDVDSPVTQVTSRKNPVNWVTSC